jgi:hypothetical protein
VELRHATRAPASNVADRLPGIFEDRDLEHMGQYPPDDAITVAETLLPDVLPYDYRLPPRLPDNERTLTDDAFDLALSVYTRWPISEVVGRIQTC